MGKFLDKVKHFFYGEKKYYEKIADCAKEKGMTDNEKFDKILKMMGHYFLHLHKDEVKMQVYELHYEEFMQKGQKNEEKFRDLFAFTSNDQILVYVSCLNNCLNKLKNLDTEKLNQTQKEIYDLTKSFGEKFVNKDFDLGKFYTNQLVRNMIIEKDNEIVSRVIQNYKQELKCDDDLFEANTAEELNNNI